MNGKAQDFADSSFPHYLSWTGAAAFEPLREFTEADGVFDGNAFDRDGDGVKGPANSCDPLVALKLFEAEGDGFKESGGGDFDGVGDAVHVGNGDAAGADLHGRKGSIFAFCSPCGSVGREAAAHGI